MNPAADRALSSGGGGDVGVLAQPTARAVSANVISTAIEFNRCEIHKRFIRFGPVVVAMRAASWRKCLEVRALRRILCDTSKRNAAYPALTVTVLVV